MRDQFVSLQRPANPSNFLDPTGQYMVFPGQILGGGIWGISIKPWLEASGLINSSASAGGYKHPWYNPPYTLPASFPIAIDVTFTDSGVQRFYINSDAPRTFSEPAERIDFLVPYLVSQASPYLAQAGTAGAFMVTVFEDPTEALYARDATARSGVVALYPRAGGPPFNTSPATPLLYLITALPAVPAPVNAINFFGLNDDQGIPAGAYIKAGPFFVFEQYRAWRMALNAAAAQDLYILSCDGVWEQNWHINEHILAADAGWIANAAAGGFDYVLERTCTFTREWILVCGSDAAHSVSMQALPLVAYEN